MSVINPGDTAWLLVSTALVMLMTPGLALFYGGMVSGKNVLSTFMHSFFAMALVSVQWALIGYSLAFGQTHGGYIGGLDYVFLQGVGVEPHGTVPHLLFMMFQGMFAVITPALISGAYAERMKFSAYCVFTVLWATLVYDPIAHWAWGPGGWLGKFGALDFAGGTVVHLSAGISAVVVATMIGKRAHYRDHQPHNLTMTVLGAGLLWFGWFGFNAGSALTSGGLAALALVNTHVAAAAGALAWGFIERIKTGRVTMFGVASGMVGGLVGITPAAGYVTPMAAIVIGGLAGGACHVGVMLKSRFGYDDALDVFGVHGVAGILGALLTGVFATTAMNPAGANGLLYGNPQLVLTQAMSIGAVALYAAAASYLILKLVGATIGLRVEAHAEHHGLDPILHGEKGYHFPMSLAPGPETNG
jgi:Amt family ammonium transporter